MRISDWSSDVCSSDLAHQLAHVGRAAGAGPGDGVVDGGQDRGLVQLLGQVALDDHDLGAPDGGQVLAVGGLELAHRVLALLDHFLQHREHGGVVELDALIDLALLARAVEVGGGSSRARVYKLVDMPVVAVSLYKKKRKLAFIPAR